MDDFDDFIYAIDGKSFLDFLVFRNRQNIYYQRNVNFPINI